MSEPQNSGDIIFTSDNTIVVVFDGPGNTTRRPRRPNIPRDWPPPEPPKNPESPDDKGGK